MQTKTNKKWKQKITDLFLNEKEHWNVKNKKYRNIHKYYYIIW